MVGAKTVAKGDLFPFADGPFLFPLSLSVPKNLIFNEGPMRRINTEKREREVEREERGGKGKIHVSGRRDYRERACLQGERRRQA